MKVVVDSKACAGHARCNHVAPGLYELDENGYIASADFTVEAGQEGLALRGARACPERAIQILEDASASTCAKGPRDRAARENLDIQPIQTTEEQQ
ncbi:MULTISPECIES: ferredoxin [Pseudomonadaceae]|uniref:ferredoxin n=1 Tax=Pseudomonadaceae TaxID=135621 RepID=UPI00103F1850|nr:MULTISPECIES: ferredoxin [Pseudomonadaceae]MBA1277987.1 ferredoxin [Stutzerimonas stutzeri]TCD23690.1 ferredoxin [Pseudomonas sp. IC_126]